MDKLTDLSDVAVIWATAIREVCIGPNQKDRIIETDLENGR